MAFNLTKIITFYLQLAAPEHSERVHSYYALYFSSSPCIWCENPLYTLKFFVFINHNNQRLEFIAFGWRCRSFFVCCCKMYCNDGWLSRQICRKKKIHGKCQYGTRMCSHAEFKMLLSIYHNWNYNCKFCEHVSISVTTTRLVRATTYFMRLMWHDIWSKYAFLWCVLFFRCP